MSGLGKCVCLCAIRPRVRSRNVNAVYRGNYTSWDAAARAKSERQLNGIVLAESTAEDKFLQYSSSVPS